MVYYVNHYKAGNVRWNGAHLPSRAEAERLARLLCQYRFVIRLKPGVTYEQFNTLPS
jgi:hypothetical protein